MFFRVLGVLLLLSGGLVIYTRWQVARRLAAYPPTGDFVTVDGVRLHYQSEGSGEAVVFLHGGILDANDYAEVFALVAAQGYRAIAFDRPGYGHSERPGSEPATPVVQARILHEALKQMGVKRPLLVAHSYSGSVAMAYALGYPDDLAGIGLLAAATYGGDLYPAGDGDSLSKLVTTTIVGAVLLNAVLVPFGSALMRTMIKKTFAPDPVPPGYLARAEALWGRPSQFKANRQDILYFSPTMKQLSPRFAEINLPVVYALGDHDPFGLDLHAQYLQEVLPQFKLIQVEGAGHMLPVTHPTAVLKVINEFSY